MLYSLIFFVLSVVILNECSGEFKAAIFVREDKKESTIDCPVKTTLGNVGNRFDCADRCLNEGPSSCQMMHYNTESKKCYLYPVKNLSCETVHGSVIWGKQIEYSGNGTNKMCTSQHRGRFCTLRAVDLGEMMPMDKTDPANSKQILAEDRTGYFRDEARITREGKFGNAANLSGGYLYMGLLTDHCLDDWSMPRCNNSVSVAMMVQLLRTSKNVGYILSLAKEARGFHLGYYRCTEVDFCLNLVVIMNGKQYTLNTTSENAVTNKKWFHLTAVVNGKDDGVTEISLAVNGEVIAETEDSAPPTVISEEPMAELNIGAFGNKPWIKDLRGRILIDDVFLIDGAPEEMLKDLAKTPNYYV